MRQRERERESEREREVLFSKVVIAIFLTKKSFIS